MTDFTENFRDSPLYNYLEELQTKIQPNDNGNITWKELQDEFETLEQKTTASPKIEQRETPKYNFTPHMLYDNIKQIIRTQIKGFYLVYSKIICGSKLLLPDEQEDIIFTGRSGITKANCNYQSK